MSKKLLKNYDGGNRLQNLENCNKILQLQSLERLERLERLEDIQNLITSVGSYSDVKIEPDSILYCDIPYKGTNVYGKKGHIQTFDFDAFYDWCAKQSELVMVSSYEMPDCFECVAEFEHRSTLSATANNKVIEKVFVSKHQIDLYNAEMPKLTLF